MLWYKQGGPVTHEKVRCEPHWGKERVLAEQLAEVRVLQAERAVKANSPGKSMLDMFKKQENEPVEGRGVQQKGSQKTDYEPIIQGFTRTLACILR